MVGRLCEWLMVVDQHWKLGMVHCVTLHMVADHPSCVAICGTIWMPLLCKKSVSRRCGDLLAYVGQQKLSPEQVIPARLFVQKEKGDVSWDESRPAEHPTPQGDAFPASSLPPPSFPALAQLGSLRFIFLAQFLSPLCRLLPSISCFLRPYIVSICRALLFRVQIQP